MRKNKNTNMNSEEVVTKNKSNKKMFVIGFAAGATIGGCSVFAACKIAEKRRAMDALLRTDYEDEEYTDENIIDSEEEAEDIIEEEEGGDEDDSEFSDRDVFDNISESSPEDFDESDDNEEEILEEELEEEEEVVEDYGEYTFEDTTYSDSTTDVMEEVAVTVVDEESGEEFDPDDMVDAELHKIDRLLKENTDESICKARAVYLDLRRSINAGALDDETRTVIERYGEKTIQGYVERYYSNSDGKYPAKKKSRGRRSRK